ncbi:MAG: cytidylate kinase family protein, partial [Clostridia bacterium]|nr:cytidylate kinase family protein [Clostridia bacterium]
GVTVMKDKISLAGDLGSGKSTVSDILIERLGAKYYSTGRIVRDIAEKRNMTVTELNVYMETHPEIDREIDDGLRALSALDEFLIIDSRMAWHFTEGTFSVYLSTDIETSALRIMNANRVGEHAATLEETVRQTRARRESEKKRYMTQYGVDIKNLENYALVVDTTAATPTEVADRIISSFEEWKNKREIKSAYITPERLYYPDTEPDADELSRLSSLLEEGEALPPVLVNERDGEFYLISGLESALAYSLAMATFIPAKLVGDEPSADGYIRMKNSL